MIDFLGHFKIKHADLPYIGIYLGLFFIIVTVVLFTAEISTVILIAVCCLPVLILLLNYHFYRAGEVFAVKQQQKQQAYFSLFNLIDFKLPIPYMTGWAATPELALTIFETIKTDKPKQIVELGSGISTLICAYAMNDNDRGALFSFDHDEKYANKTRTMLSNHQIDQRITIHHAPLKSQNIDGRECIWYDCSNANCPEPIDMLIVDGPPFETQDKSRYPAFSYFLPKLSPSAVIIVHDAFREAESAIVHDWLRGHPEFSKEMIDSEKGIAILRRG